MNGLEVFQHDCSTIIRVPAIVVLPIKRMSEPISLTKGRFQGRSNFTKRFISIT